MPTTKARNRVDRILAFGPALAWLHDRHPETHATFVTRLEQGYWTDSQFVRQVVDVWDAGRDPIGARLDYHTDVEPTGVQTAWEATVRVLVPHTDQNGVAVDTPDQVTEYLSETLRTEVLDWCPAGDIERVNVCEPYIEGSWPGAASAAEPPDPDIATDGLRVFPDVGITVHVGADGIRVTTDHGTWARTYDDLPFFVMGDEHG